MNIHDVCAVYSWSVCWISEWTVVTTFLSSVLSPQLKPTKCSSNRTFFATNSLNSSISRVLFNYEIFTLIIKFWFQLSMLLCRICTFVTKRFTYTPSLNTTRLGTSRYQGYVIIIIIFIFRYKQKNEKNTKIAIQLEGCQRSDWLAAQVWFRVDEPCQTTILYRPLFRPFRRLWRLFQWKANVSQSQ